MRNETRVTLRICAAPGCETFLSRFNPDPFCGPCTIRRRHREDARLERTHPRLPIPDAPRKRVRGRHNGMTVAEFDAWMDREIAAMCREVLNAPMGA